MRVSIIGTGYVGLVTGVCLADKGHHVVCVDVDEEKVYKINKAIPPIYEKSLEELLRKNIGVNLRATADIHKSVLETDISLIAVGTPFDGSEIDLTYIKEVSCRIGEALKEKTSYHVVVVKSTVVPGTTDEVVLPILESVSGKKAGIDFGVGMNPEFLREGEAVQDFMFPDRLVLGGIDEKSINALAELYGAFEGVDQLRTNNKTAEIIKYTANALLATMISFSNEIANLCAAIGHCDVVEVMKGVHLDKRLSPLDADGSRVVPAFTAYLEAGCGFGGSCFPKDVKALIAYGKKLSRPMQLLDAVISINEQQPGQVTTILKRHFPSLKGISVTVLGLAFKPGTNDLRESPSISVIRELLSDEAKVRAYDPVAQLEAKKVFGNKSITYCDSLSHALEEAQAVLLLTRWEEFRGLPGMLARLNPQPLFIDGRRMLEKSSITRYEGIGLGSSQSFLQ
jgi:UDPglucose 6-dehydrogenase/GDP-mannose 6-dehydrogenase